MICETRFVGISSLSQIVQQTAIAKSIDFDNELYYDVQEFAYLQLLVSSLISNLPGHHFYIR